METKLDEFTLQENSFSVPSYKNEFMSQLGVLVSKNTECDENDQNESEDDDDDDDDESYIEIEIEPKKSVVDKNVEFQFRISFSSIVPEYPSLLCSNKPSVVSTNNVVSDKITKTESSLSSTSGLAFSTSASCSTFSFSSSINSSLQKMVVNDLEKSWGVCDQKGYGTSKNKFNWDLSQSRRTSKIAATINDGITKLMIKFRLVKLESIVSFMKRPNKSSVLQRYKIKHDTQMFQRDQTRRCNSTYASNVKNSCFATTDDHKNWRPKEGKPRRKSCPSSIKSSPIHSGLLKNEESKMHARDVSVQGAIAHCKKSFGDQCAKYGLRP